MATDVKARLTNTGISAQKVRLVIDMVRGKSVADALNILKFANRVCAPKKTSVWTGMTCMSTRFTPTKLRHASGGISVRAAVSSRFCAALPTLPLFFANVSNMRPMNKGIVRR